MKNSAQVVLLNEEGLVLAVSRKDNHSDFGLIGGKQDPEDASPEAAAIREVKEETGLDIYDLQLVFAMHKNGYMGYTYLAKYKGEINHNEPHVVKWAAFEVIMNGSFGKFNTLVSESLDDMGIKYIKELDKKFLEKDVSELIEEHYGGKLKLDFLFKNKCRFSGSDEYQIRFEDESGELEETFGDDEILDKKLEELSKKHGVKIILGSGYYAK